MINVDELRNKKQLGEIEESIAISELSKYGLYILLPMSSNLPLHFLIYYNNKFCRTQVKTTASTTVNNSMNFSLTSNNYNKGTVHKYNEDEIYIIICCDLHNIYIFPECYVANRNSITISEEPPANNQTKRINFAKDCIISIERLNYTFSKIEK